MKFAKLIVRSQLSPDGDSMISGGVQYGGILPCEHADYVTFMIDFLNNVRDRLRRIVAVLNPVPPPPSIDSAPVPTDLFSSVIANVLIIGTAAYAGMLHFLDPDLYYLSVQEDEYLECSTFWAFIGASVLFVVAAARERRLLHTVPWFVIGLAAFCLLVALEEISWGQRIFGYRPPRYFLEHNFQQELNLHNIVDTDYRQWALAFIILGYGVVLPIVARVPVTKRFFDGIGIAPPPVGLIPAFAATWTLYVWYPWSHSGEWVELMLGTGFAFCALSALHALGASGKVRHRMQFAIVVLWLFVIGTGAASASVSRTQRSGHAENVGAAVQEIEALKLDLLAGQRYLRCNVHKRVYAYVAKYRAPHLTDGAFARLTTQGLPEERAEFFLDPWNSPYWIRSRCANRGRERLVFVYSFGPNRRRESDRESIIKDDIGSIVIEPENGH